MEESFRIMFDAWVRLESTTTDDYLALAHWNNSVARERALLLVQSVELCGYMRNDMRVSAGTLLGGPAPMADPRRVSFLREKCGATLQRAGIPA